MSRRIKRRRDSQREKNAISVRLRFLHSENLGHLKEYGWISNTATAAELNLLNSPAGEREREGKEEVREQVKKEGKKTEAEEMKQKGRGERREGEAAIDAGKTAEGQEEEIWGETEEAKGGGREIYRRRRH